MTPATAHPPRVAPSSGSTSKLPMVALVGPPNAGKSTLFNRLTGLRQKIANFPGVTVEKKLGLVTLPNGKTIDLVDLPGVNGFSARTLDERVTRDVLEGRVDGMRAPDALILIVDSTRLEPQLMLVEPTLEIGVPTLLVLNMSDELADRGGSVDAAALGEQLGVEVVVGNARTGVGIERIHEFLEHVAARGLLPERPCPAISNVSRGQQLPVVDAFAARRQHIREVGRTAQFQAPGPSRSTQKLDSIFLHRIGGPLIFVGVVLLVFQAMFTWATPLMDGVEWFISVSGEWVAGALPDIWLRSLLIDGVWAGVGSVMVFLPQILILFFFLGILEDSGYMARAAVIADRMMHRVGLQGRSFLPLLSAYACAIPAILAARTVEDERDRMTTMFIAPFMTCSARLPVYALLIAAFIPDKQLLGPFMGYRSAMLLGLYGLGLLAAIGTAFVLKRTLLKGEPSDFMMELPPYRVPTARSIGLRLLDRTKVFLKRAGRIILLVTVVLWGLAQFPGGPSNPPAIEDSALGRIGQVIEPAIAPLGFDWQIGIGLVSSLAAREVIVGTLGTIYGISEADEGSLELQEALQSQLDLGAAVGLLVFFVFALQCMSTVAVMKRETGGWKWPALQFSYMFALGYVGAFLANYFL